MTKAQFTLCNSWTVTQRAFESTTTRAAAEGLDQRSHADSNLFVWFFFFFSSFSVRLIYPTPCFLILHIMESEDEEAGRTVASLVTIWIFILIRNECPLAICSPLQFKPWFRLFCFFSSSSPGILSDCHVPTTSACWLLLLLLLRWLLLLEMIFQSVFLTRIKCRIFKWMAP